MKDRKEYLSNYHSKNIIQKKINFNRNNENDMEMLEFIETKENFSKYAKDLIFQDIEQSK